MPSLWTLLLVRLVQRVGRRRNLRHGSPQYVLIYTGKAAQLTLPAAIRTFSPSLKWPQNGLIEENFLGIWWPVKAPCSFPDVEFLLG